MEIIQDAQKSWIVDKAMNQTIPAISKLANLQVVNIRKLKVEKLLLDGFERLSPGFTERLEKIVDISLLELALLAFDHD